MGPVTAFLAFAGTQFADWRGTRLADLHFWNRGAAWLALVVGLLLTWLPAEADARPAKRSSVKAAPFTSPW